MAVYYPQCQASIHVVFDGFGGQEKDPVTFTVRPKQVTVHLNGYREADTFSMDFDAAGFPFSPELIRSMAVEIHMWQTDGLGGKFRTTADPVANDSQGLVIAGLVDDARYHAGSDGRVFSVSGRDYTALMLDRQWNPANRFPSGLPLKDAVQQLVDEASGASRTGRILNVKVVGTDETPTLGKPDSKQSALITAGKFRAHTAKSGKTKLTVPTTGKGNVHMNKKGVPVKGGSSYWDVIYRQCIRLGFVVFVRGTDVVISTPQTLTDATAGRLRSVAFGRDLSTLDIDRKLGKETVPTIRVVCYDPVSMRSIEGLYPKDKKQVTTGIGTKKDEIREVVVHGINDQGTLDALAEMYYANLARSEATFKFSTKDLTDLDGNDLIYLRPGDPVQLGFDALNDEEYRQLSEAQRYERLLGLGYDERIAALIATEYDKINQFRMPYYTKDVELEWSNSDGLRISVEAINFVSEGRDGGSILGTNGTVKL